MKKSLFFSLFAFVFCSFLFAQTPTMVKDLNPDSSLISSSSPQGIIVSNNIAYFNAETELHGRELWRSDGTEEGTYMLKDIRIGEENSSPSDFFAHNGIIYFSANDGVYGFELWKTDGTSDGTVLVKDINPGVSGSSPTSFAFHNKIFFRANNGTNGTELWYTDGTEENTQMLDLDIGSGSSYPRYFTKSGNYLYFTASDGIHGQELWKTDGTIGNTAMIKDISPGSGNSINVTTGPFLTDVDGMLYFAASDGVNGTELWISDGDPAKTVMVEDINTSGASLPNALVNMNGTCYFSCYHPSYGYELWKSNGDAASTDMVEDIRLNTLSSNPRQMIAANGWVYFTCDDGTGYDLWKTDGATNTIKVSEVTSFYVNNPISYVNGLLYFQANNSLWYSDGDASASELKTDCSGISEGVITLNGAEGIFKATSSQNGYELWKTDGTTPETNIIKEIGIWYDRFDSPGLQLKDYSNHLYFEGFDGNDLIGHELWSSDGTSDNTQLVANVAPEDNVSSYPTQFYHVNDTLYFRGYASGGNAISKYYHGDANAITIHKTSGSANIEGNLNGLLVLRISDSLYTYNTSNGILSFITEESQMQRFTQIENKIFFIANGPSELALWSTDGTVFGTQMIKDNFASGAKTPDNFTIIDSFVFFSASDGGDMNLWWSDGTESGTQLFSSDITGGDFMKTYNNDIFFGALIDGVYSLCKKNISTFSNNEFDIIYEFDQNISILDGFLYKGELYLIVEQTRSYQQIWKTDGTNEGTKFIAEINTLISNDEPKGFTNYNGIIYFSAIANNHGKRLWRTDGTSEGTYFFPNVNCTVRSNKDIEVSNDILFFIGDDGINGGALWKYECHIQIDSHSVAQNVCLNDQLLLNAYGSSSTEPIEHQWQFFDEVWINIIDDSNISGSQSDSLVIMKTTADHNGNYRCIISGECGYDTTEIITISVNELPSVQINSTKDTKIICPDSDVDISATGAMNYSWEGIGILQSTGESSIVNISVDSSLIKVTGTDVNGCMNTDSIWFKALKPYNEKVSAFVTVDPFSGKNMIVWQKPYNEGIYSFNVSKGLETSPTLLDNIRFQDYNRFIDYGSTPKQNYDDYYITISDTCGTTTDIIEHHRPIHLQVNINTVAIPNEVNLSWNEYLGFEYDSFYVYRGTDSTDLEFVRGIPHNAPPFTYTEELEGQKIYYKVVVNAPQTVFLEGNKKANAGPFSRSVSNLEDNRQRATSFKPQAASGKLEVYPNPMRERCTILFDNSDNSKYILSIFDYSGKKVKTIKDIYTNTVTLSSQELSKGFYIIELKGSKNFRSKLIVE